MKGYNYLLSNSYDIIFILKPDLDENNILALVEKYHRFLHVNGAININAYDRGRRHLSYPIKKYHDGIYIQITYQADNQILTNLEKAFRIDDNVIRYLTVKILLPPILAT
uniref:ribosomal protein S6 n=1 Tax=Goniotrichopsis reniformis TaxID=468933 RepID=UPI001FCE2A7D|nr:ribosomal protein S6 [Goniotrichopsis reniformis]UNJ14815.1 ribosomal protein S6 [Goniotrichopsis reniformis]